MKKSGVKKLLITSLSLVSLSVALGATQADASAQGDYIKDGSTVQITKKNYEIWQNFGWKEKNNTSNVYNQTFDAKGRYQHQNGSTYYSLYDNKGTWYGYLNANATKKIDGQGSYISDGSTVQITKNYEIWQNFSWKKKEMGSTYFNQQVQAKGRYEHFNGNTYYSLYTKTGSWLGYINANATSKTKSEGNYISDGRYVEITKNYELWQNFSWKKKGMGSTQFKKSLQAKGRYEHFNGNTYYSVYDEKGTWLGYINATATKSYQPKQTKETKTINKDTSNKVLKDTKGYKKVSEETDKGKVSKKPNGDTHTLFTKTIIWKKDQTTELPSDIGNSGMQFNTKAEAYDWGYDNNPNPNGSFFVYKMENGKYTVDFNKETPTNEDKYETINKDDKGKVLPSNVDLTKYTKVSEDTKQTVKTLSNGNTITTHTTTVIYKLNTVYVPKHEEQFLTVYKDDKGNILPDDFDINEYIEVSSIADNGVKETFPNGDTMTTYTTTITYELKEDHQGETIHTYETNVYNQNGVFLGGTIPSGYSEVSRKESEKTVKQSNGDTLIIHITDIVVRIK
ncbi:MULTISPECIES: hypothetical protein [Vagococcus]|uniref:Uncharacterized protein n=1 Tax=Vagococcus fluvialis bH819 TaxID=1255619 RepID=A0A1X6WPW6_9ENTE|nr:MULTISPECIES: hypothetical protein [Vagococcus]SLM86354.1 hypothetical protein FM121_09705 [Vagococcus fluvialis bH819]HCM89009.1 hypothetical protein [Vagococcus sp.]